MSDNRRRDASLVSKVVLGRWAALLSCIALVLGHGKATKSFWTLEESPACTAAIIDQKL